jgi:hypothetical protein
MVAIKFIITITITIITIITTITIIISPLQSTTGHRLFRHLAHSSSTRIQLLPAVLRKSSLHLAEGVLYYVYRDAISLHSRTRLPQRWSVLRLVWPAHCHFSMLIRCAMLVTLVLCRITWFRFDPAEKPKHKIIMS